MNPFFSIIIPLYNGERTIAACLTSIINQSFHNYEVLIADGCSTDKSLKIIQQLKEGHQSKNIHLFTEKDGGIYDAMNKSMDLATGDWLYFMGCDDEFDNPEVLKNIYQALENETLDLIYGNVSGMATGTQYVYDTLTKVLSQGIHHQSIFYKKSMLTRIGRYDERFKVAADYHLTLKIFTDTAFKTRYLNLSIANYGESGLSSRVYDYKFFSYHYKFLAQHGAADQIGDREGCLRNSIYCCLTLARTKQNLFFGWHNLLYYVSRSNDLPFIFKLKTLMQMIYWSIKPYNGSTGAPL